MVSITISTSDSLDIDNTYIETPTVTAIPANIILVRTLMWSRIYINSHCFQPSDSWGKFSWVSHQNSEECVRNDLHTLNTFWWDTLQKDSQVRMLRWGFSCILKSRSSILGIQFKLIICKMSRQEQKSKNITLVM